jgi:lipid II:glycine glycyltransferase (peptidoglycan interpeptide bridge formation enzyme)
MALEIRKNITKKEWDSFLSQFYDFSPFAQSFVWGDILITEGKEVEKLAIFEGGEQIAAVLIVYEKLPFGWKYAFSPKGPVISKKLKVESCKVVMNEIKDYLKEKKCVFWRLEPNIQYPISNIQIVKVKDINPSNTLILYLE